MKNNQNLKSTKSAVKVGTSIIVTILILLLVFLMNLSYQVIGYSPNTANGTSFTYRTLRSNRNILCSSKNKHLSNYTWKLQNKATTTVSNTAEAYLFAYATENGRGTGTDQYYGDHIQQAYWHMCNSNTGKANAIYKEAMAYENYINNYQALRIQNLRNNGNNSISFTITGSHNDSYGFGEIVSVDIRNGSGSIIAHGANKYGTQTVNDITADSVCVTVRYRKFLATSTYSKYTTKRKSGGKTYTGQPIVIFRGNFSNGEVSEPAKSTTIMLKTDVSLQKYVRRVNGEEFGKNATTLTRRIDTMTAKNETNANAKKQNISTTHTADITYKRDAPVKIELNDTVTYRITVYNNSNATASNIIVKDALPYTTNSNGTIKSWATLESVYRGNTKISAVKDNTNKNTYQWTIGSLGAGNSVSFDVTLKFTENTSAVLTNSAWISSTTPTNERNYRTMDRDYVKMNQYKVQLKKYVSSTELNGNITSYANNITNDSYPNIRNWATEHYDTSAANTLDNLKNKYFSLRDNQFSSYTNLINNAQISTTAMSNVKAINEIDKLLADWKELDVNQDNQITQEDIELIEIQKINSSGTITLTQETLTKIAQYIASDINNDGVVNETDKTLYQVIKSDLTEDKILDEKDIYFLVSLISDLNGDNKLDTTDLAIVKTKYLQETYGSDDNVINMINVYIKSDIDNDGIITEKEDSSSSEGFDENAIHITDEGLQETYDIGNYVIENPSDKLQQALYLLQQYDINHDNSFNSNDFDSIEDYKNDYSELLEKYQLDPKYQETAEDENGNLYNKYYTDLENYISTEEVTDENGNILIPYNQQYDFNGDDNVNRDDLFDFYEVMTYEKMIDNLTEMSQTQYDAYMEELDINKDDEINIIDISLFRIATGEKSYNSEITQNDTLAVILDINGDGLVNGEDLTEYRQHQNMQINEIDTVFLRDLDFIKYLQSAVQLETIDVSNLSTNDYDFNGDGVIDKNDVEVLEENITTFEKDEELTNFLANNQQTEISFDENQTNVSIKSLDAYAVGDEAGKINENDYSYLADLLSSHTADNITTYTGNLSTETMQTFLSLADLNENSAVEEIEINMIKASYNVDFDLNDDGYINLDDVALYEEIEKFIKNGANTDDLASSIKRNISPEANHPNYSTNADDLSGKTTNYYNNGTQNLVKYNNPVEVECGMTVTYTIELKNNSAETKVRISQVTDVLPNNIELMRITNSNNNDISYSQSGNTVVIKPNITLGTKESAILYVTVTVKEPNMSLACLRNVAEITKIENPEKNVTVTDTTPYDNLDADYIQLKDITIEGMVWNDKALDKDQNNYNALYDDGEEGKISGIKVYLYRTNNTNHQIVSSKLTDINGKYKFTSDDIGKAYSENGDVTGTYSVANNAKFIKGPQVSNTVTRWSGSYYSYYIVFEYDGITYTSTPDGMSYIDITDSTAYENGEYRNNSNAREKLNQNDTFDGYIAQGKARKEFNDRFSTIHNESGIEYTTKNESSYIPQSNHVYNEETMAMQSSTNLIELSRNADLEEQLKYVNLGLRGRDIFDLELTSDVARTQVKVNNKVGVYQFSNKVNIRGTDLVSGEDMANIANESSNPYVEDRNNEEGQQISNTDLNTSRDYTGTNKENYNSNQGLQEIQVTYKITVTNASQTLGTVAKVVDYYDKDYSNPTAELYRKDTENDTEVKVKDIEITNSNITEGTNYNKVELNIGEDIQLSQSQSYYIYLTLTMDIQTLRNLFTNDGNLSYPTYNMAEIAEYKTYALSEENEYTRGLLDKDSAPGSVEREQVRTTATEGQNTATTGGNPTTVDYYFSKKTNNTVDLSILKYEDDTYATPTLYFVSVDRKRTLEGTVFEDYTEIIDNDGTDQSIRVKTGNGIKDDLEPGIKGVTVQLVELDTNKNPENIEYNEGKIRYETQTNENGYYKFEGFLPGNYIVRYIYGDTESTFTYDNHPNTKSYNGEDFQSTNNTGKIGETETDKMELYPLSNKEDYWYAYNEAKGGKAVSTGTDNSERRKEVSTAVTGFTDEQMTVLNNVRDGKPMEEANKNSDGNIMTYQDKKTGKEVEVKTEDIMNDTKMFATTRCMELTMEKTVAVTEDDTTQNRSFLDYTVSNMNFGIAEVPVTTIDLQKHVNSLEITDSAGTNTIAKATIDTNNTRVSVNPSKIAENKLDTVIAVLSKNLNMDEKEVRDLVNYEVNKSIDDNIMITETANKEQSQGLQYDMTMYSLAGAITITKSWKVEAGNVITAPGINVLDISIEDEKLQGAKLEVTYEITASIYAEKNFNNDAATIPSIKGIADYIDNDLSYNPEQFGGSQTGENKNSYYWTVAKQEDVAKLYQQAEQYIYGTDNDSENPDTEFDIGSTNSNTNRLGTLDPDGTKYTTILTANEIESGLLLEECGTGTSYITLERVLTSEDSSIGDIITSSINTYEYDNNIEITGLDYTNTISSNTDNFIYRDRVRTPDRYIILAGIQHDTATSETIAIHPPTGENNSIMYYVIAVISLGILVIGIVLIKKYAIKK